MYHIGGVLYTKLNNLETTKQLINIQLGVNEMQYSLSETIYNYKKIQITIFDGNNAIYRAYCILNVSLIEGEKYICIPLIYSSSWYSYVFVKFKSGTVITAATTGYGSSGWHNPWLRINGIV